MEKDPEEFYSCGCRVTTDARCPVHDPLMLINDDEPEEPEILVGVWPWDDPFKEE